MFHLGPLLLLDGIGAADPGRRPTKPAIGSQSSIVARGTGCDHGSLNRDPDTCAGLCKRNSAEDYERQHFLQCNAMRDSKIELQHLNADRRRRDRPPVVDSADLRYPEQLHAQLLNHHGWAIPARRSNCDGVVRGAIASRNDRDRVATCGACNADGFCRYPAEGTGARTKISNRHRGFSVHASSVRTINDSEFDTRSRHAGTNHGARCTSSDDRSEYELRHHTEIGSISSDLIGLHIGSQNRLMEPRSCLICVRLLKTTPFAPSFPNTTP